MRAAALTGIPVNVRVNGQGSTFGGKQSILNVRERLVKRTARDNLDECYEIRT